MDLISLSFSPLGYVVLGIVLALISFVAYLFSKAIYKRLVKVGNKSETAVGVISFIGIFLSILAVLFFIMVCVLLSIR